MMSPQKQKILKKPVKIACVQLASSANKEYNVKEARRGVVAAAAAGAALIILPECFNSPYSTASFPEYAEILQPSPPSEEASPTYHALSLLAREANAYLVGGSIPELEVESKKYYSTTLVFSPRGDLLGSHRKVHLFNIDIPGQMRFQESETLSAGNAISIVHLPDYGSIGLGICYDVRFPEPAMIAARTGAFALIYPSAFNSTTGPLHWELLARSRALDNQVFVVMCAQAFDPESTYPAWGHSIVADPNGQIAAICGREETIIYADLDDEAIQESRRNIPTSTQRRFDLYADVSNTAAAGVRGT